MLHDAKITVDAGKEIPVHRCILARIGRGSSGGRSNRKIPVHRQCSDCSLPPPRISFSFFLEEVPIQRPPTSFSSGWQGAILAGLIAGVNIIKMLLLGLGIMKDDAPRFLQRVYWMLQIIFAKIDVSQDAFEATPLLKTLLEGVELTEKQLLEGGRGV